MIFVNDKLKIISLASNTWHKIQNITRPIIRFHREYVIKDYIIRDLTLCLPLMMMNKEISKNMTHLCKSTCIQFRRNTFLRKRDSLCWISGKEKGRVKPTNFTIKMHL